MGRIISWTRKAQTFIYIVYIGLGFPGPTNDSPHSPQFFRGEPFSPGEWGESFPPGEYIYIYIEAFDHLNVIFSQNLSNCIVFICKPEPPPHAIQSCFKYLENIKHKLFIFSNKNLCVAFFENLSKFQSIK